MNKEEENVKHIKDGLNAATKRIQEEAHAFQVDVIIDLDQIKHMALLMSEIMGITSVGGVKKPMLK